MPVFHLNLKQKACFLASKFIAVLVFVSSASACPANCNCEVNGNLNCVNADLVAIPAIPTMYKNVTLNGNNIKTIPQDSFHGRSLNYLKLDNNSIQFIEPFAFRSLTETGELSLINNKIEALDPSSLGGIYKLHHLDLRWNNISHIGHDAFMGSRDISKIVLTNNPIRTIDHGAFAGLNNVEHFHISVPYVKELSKGTFDRMSNVETLQINNANELRLVSKAFSGLSHVETLIIAGSNITSVDPEVFVGMTDVDRILIRDCVIDRIYPRAFAGMGDSGDVGALEIVSSVIKRIDIDAFEDIGTKTQVIISKSVIYSLPVGTFNSPSMFVRENYLPCNCFSERLKAEDIIRRNNWCGDHEEGASHLGASAKYTCSSAIHSNENSVCLLIFLILMIVVYNSM